MADRPPPYFPQTSLNPSDDKRYLKFKLFVGLGILVLLGLVVGAGIGIYYLFSWIAS